MKRRDNRNFDDGHFFMFFAVFKRALSSTILRTVGSCTVLLLRSTVIVRRSTGSRILCFLWFHVTYGLLGVLCGLRRNKA